MKVMLVDDSRTVRNVQKKMLAQLGFTDIVEAGNGVQALAAYKECPPDLMLIDWDMPIMDGIALVKAIRRTDRFTPMIMCTTEAEKSRVVETLEASVNSYMVKPFTAETLSENVNQALSELAVAAS